MGMTIEEKRKINSRRLFYAIGCLGIVEFALMALKDVYLDVPGELFIVTMAIAAIIGIIPIAIFAHRAQKLETAFWKEVATQYGYAYVYRPYFQDKALMFQEGHGKATGHGLTGTLLDRPFRFFQYRYTTGSGKHRQTHHYCVSEIVFTGSFPHIYLNNVRNRNLTSIKSFFLPRVALPAPLEGKFNLHGPKGYEIEVLEIFTPDILAHLLDVDWQHDFELVDQKLYIFREKPLRTKQELEEEIERLQKFLTILTPKLNRMKLAPIGDLSHKL